MKKAVAYTIIAFWGIMAALFVRREVIPKLYAQPMRGYQSLRAYAQTHAGYRMGAWTPNGEKIGVIETAYQFKENGDCEIASKASIRFEKHSLMSLALPPAEAKRPTFEMWSNVTIGADNALKTFRIACDTPVGSGFVYGSVIGSSLKITINIAGTRTVRLVPVAEDDILSSGFMAIGALPDLRVGQAWRIRMLDPLKMLDPGQFPFTAATAHVKQRTRIQLRGAWYAVYEVELARAGVVARAWVTDDGDVLKEEAFNIVLIREPLPHEEGAGSAVSATSPPAGP